MLEDLPAVLERVENIVLLDPPLATVERFEGDLFGSLSATRDGKDLCCFIPCSSGGRALFFSRAVWRSSFNCKNNKKSKLLIRYNRYNKQKQDRISIKFQRETTTVQGNNKDNPLPSIRKDLGKILETTCCLAKSMDC